MATKTTAGRKRKNFLPTLLVTVFLWSLIGGLLYFVSPQTPAAVPAFFVLFFLALLFTFSTMFADTRRGLLTSSSLTLFALLRYFGVGNFLNLLLLVGLALVVEIYFYKS